MGRAAADQPGTLVGRLCGVASTQEARTHLRLQCSRPHCRSRDGTPSDSKRPCSGTTIAAFRASIQERNQASPAPSASRSCRSAARRSNSDIAATIATACSSKHCLVERHSMARRLDGDARQPGSNSQGQQCNPRHSTIRRGRPPRRRTGGMDVKQDQCFRPSSCARAFSSGNMIRRGFAGHTACAPHVQATAPVRPGSAP